MALVLNGTTGVSKVQDGIVTSASIADATIQPIDLAQNMTLMTAQTASGTSVDFTGIPSWAKRVTVMFNGVSTNGTSHLLVQLGDSGGIENTAYTAISSSFDGATTQLNVTSTAGFILHTGAATIYELGSMRISKYLNNTYIEDATTANSIGGMTVSSGIKALTTELTTVRITTVNGTDVFDAGTINIMYEG